MFNYSVYGVRFRGMYTTDELIQRTMTEAEAKALASAYRKAKRQYIKVYYVKERGLLQ